MAWLPPVNLPDLSQRDYSGQIYGMVSGVGEAFRQNRRDAVGDEQWEKNYARQLDLDAWNKAQAERDYALELQKFEADQAGGGGGDEFALQPFYMEGPGGELIPAQTKKSGGYEMMDIPEGYKVAPGVHYEDFGTYIGVFDRAGNLIGTRPKQGAMQPGMVQTGGMDPAGVPGGVAPMPGTKESIERTQAQTQARSRLNAASTQAGVVIQEIDNVIRLADKPGAWATGTGGAVMDVVGAVAPTSRGELVNSLATIKGNISFDKLQAMREMSPTGGALGQVSDFENRLLQATAGPIDPMNPEQMKQTLLNIKDRYEDAVVAHHIAYLTDFEGLPRDVADQAIDAIRAGKDPQAVLQRIQEIAGGG